MAMHALILNSSCIYSNYDRNIFRSKCLFQKILQRNDSYAQRTQTWNANYTVWRTAMFSRFSRWITTTINLFPQESSVYPRSKLLYLCPTESHLLVGLAAHTLWAKTHLSIKNTCERFHLNGRHKHPVWCRKYIVKLYPRFDNSTTFERLAFLKIPLFSFQLFLQGSFKSKILIVKTEYVFFFRPVDYAGSCGAHHLHYHQWLAGKYEKKHKISSMRRGGSMIQLFRLSFIL